MALYISVKKKSVINYIFCSSDRLGSINLLRPSNKWGTKQVQADHTLFYKHKDGKIITLIVYVDNIILTRDDKWEMEDLKDKLAMEFEIKDLG